MANDLKKINIKGFAVDVLKMAAILVIALPLSNFVVEQGKKVYTKVMTKPATPAV
ncbi:MAG: hypothetical protein WCT77_00160 [Bacteroidota bacterium]|jgi:hypothetical protein